MNKKAPRWSLLASYAVPAFAVSLPTIPIYIYLPAFYGVHLGLGLATTGAILLIARLFDTITDPIIGEISDRFPLHGNFRKPWICVGAFIAGIGLFKLLQPPVSIDSWYLLTWSIILYVGWTMVTVPYLAWGAELATDYHERTKITTWREATGLVGILAAGSLIAGATTMGWSETKAIGALAWGAIILGIVTFPFLLLRVPDRSLIRPNRSTSQIKANAKALGKNKPFLRLLTAWFLNGIANGIPAALFFIYLEHQLGATPIQRAIFVMVYFLAAVLSMPLWLYLSKRFGKHKIWCLAMAAACLAFLFVLIVSSGQLVIFGIICVVTGIALGADLALPPSIQADVVDYHALKFYETRAGLLFALWGMATKFALAISVGIALPILEFVGFDPTAPTKFSTLLLTVIYSLIPIIIKISSIIIIWDFPLTSKRHSIIRRRLNSRKERNGCENMI